MVGHSNGVCMCICVCVGWTKFFKIILEIKLLNMWQARKFASKKTKTNQLITRTVNIPNGFQIKVIRIKSNPEDEWM